MSGIINLFYFMKTISPMKEKIRFSQFIEEVKLLKSFKTTLEPKKYDRFCAIIDEMSTKYKDRKSKSNRFKSKPNLTLLFKTLNDLKTSVYTRRVNETKYLVNRNLEMFKFSSFELMEHNFRENTHSNVLKYIFDYNFTENSGVEALFLLLNNTKGNDIEKIKSKLQSKKYIVEREVYTGNGRIDLLITDEYNKFLIVIENKILASIADKGFDENNSTSITQLDQYRDYIFKNERFKSWDKVFILLSYKEIEEFNDTDFELIDYNMLLKILEDVKFKDSVVKDYLILLYSLTRNIYDKGLLISKANQLKDNYIKINLNTLETLNYFIYGNKNKNFV